MSDIEQFSRERNLDEWTRAKDSVTIEGTLQEDGDYYVIDREPRNVSSSLIRVRKIDVTRHQESRAVSVSGLERQFYFISIKRGMPVEMVKVLESDDLASPAILPPDPPSKLNPTAGMIKIERRQSTQLSTGKDDHDRALDFDPGSDFKGDDKFRDRSQDNDPTDRGDSGV